MMLFGLMNLQSNLKPTKDFAAESKEKHPDQSQGDHFVLT